MLIELRLRKLTMRFVSLPSTDALLCCCEGVPMCSAVKAVMVLSIVSPLVLSELLPLPLALLLLLLMAATTAVAQCLGGHSGAVSS
jgi:hypothetical protein